MYLKLKLCASTRKRAASPQGLMLTDQPSTSQREASAHSATSLSFISLVVSEALEIPAPTHWSTQLETRSTCKSPQSVS